MLPQEVLFKEAYVILQAAKSISNELDPVIDCIVANKVKGFHLILSGAGKNANIAQKAADTFSSMDIPSFYLDAYSALHGDIGVVLKDQLIIGLSKSGNTEELNVAFDIAGKKGAKLVGITCNKEAGLGKICKKYNGIEVYVPCEFEADALNVAPTCSSTLLLSICDAIGCVAAEKLGLTKEKFLENHPAGSLGTQLRKELHK